MILNELPSNDTWPLSPSVPLLPHLRLSPPPLPPVNKNHLTISQVKLPGKNSKSPQSFAFGTPYLEIHDALVRVDETLFRRNSVLALLERDAVTKRAPERWQALESQEVASFDVVVCFESRVFDLVVEGTHIINYMF